MYLAIPALMTGCRSQKTLLNESRNQVATDTVTLIAKETSGTSLSENTKSLTLASDIGERIEFQEYGGEIRLHPDGNVTLTGVAAYEVRNKNISAIHSSSLSINDSVTTDMKTESSQKNETSTGRRTTVDKANTSARHSIDVFAVILMLLISAGLFHFVRKIKS